MSTSASLAVMVVSECDDLRAACAWMLNAAGCSAKIVSASSEASTHELLDSERIDCVLLDASCLCADGVLRSVDPAARPDRIPVIIVSDVPKDAGAPGGLSEGHLCLPRASLSPQLLAQTIQSAMEASAMRLMLDEQGRELKRLHELEQAHFARAGDEPDPGNAGDAARHGNSVGELTWGRAIAGTARSVEITGHDASGTREATAGPTEQRTAPARGDDEELAARVQQALMPPGSPLMEGYEVAGLSLPAQATGGDYYDYLPMSPDLLTVAIGECSGRGVAPVILMSSLRAYLRVLSRRTRDIADVVTEANTLITDDIGDGEFLVTLLLVQIESATRTLRYCSAGLQAHVIDRSGAVRQLSSTGMPLGLRRETVIPTGEPEQLSPGDLLLLTTDGLQKVASVSGDLFGLDRMLHIVTEHRDLPPRMIVNFLKKACLDFGGPAGQTDDITVVIVKASSQ